MQISELLTQTSKNPTYKRGYLGN